MQSWVFWIFANAHIVLEIQSANTGATVLCASAKEFYMQPAHVQKNWLVHPQTWCSSKMVEKAWTIEVRNTFKWFKKLASCALPNTQVNQEMAKLLTRTFAVSVCTKQCPLGDPEWMVQAWSDWDHISWHNINLVRHSNPTIDHFVAPLNSLGGEESANQVADSLLPPTSVKTKLSYQHKHIVADNQTRVLAFDSHMFTQA